MGPTLKISEEIHKSKYRGRGEGFREAMNRIASALADDEDHFYEFRSILLDMRFLPAGRIQAGAGSTKNVTLQNCFVSGVIEDTFTDGSGSIMDRATQAAQTMRMGGGIGYDFSTLRPRGELIKKLQSNSSGPVSFMEIYDAVCRATSSAGNRRGAQMGVLRIDHPDIEEFIYAKQNTDKLTGFNVSVGVTDEFMLALKGGRSFDLRWGGKVYKTVDALTLWETLMRSTWDWAEPGVLFIDRMNEMNNLYYCEKITATNPCVRGDTKIFIKDKGKVEEVAIEDVEGEWEVWDGYNWVKVFVGCTGYDQEMVTVHFSNGSSLDCTLYHKFLIKGKGKLRATSLKSGDALEAFWTPEGVKIDLEVTHVKEASKADKVYCFHNPINGTGVFNGIMTGQCGEQPLPPFGACLLGSFNLTRYIRGTHPNCTFNWDLFRQDIPRVVRAMDSVVDVSRYPLPEQEREAQAKRRMGLGITGVANAGEALGYVYASDAYLAFQEKVLYTLAQYAYEASSGLAQEKGPFPLFDREAYLESKFVQKLPTQTRDMIARYGMRNSHLTSIAPTGTISLCADNISSGIEPVFSHFYDRTILVEWGRPIIERVEDYGYRNFGVKGKTANECSAEDHLRVLSSAYKYVDSAVSKTCNVSSNMAWEDFKSIYVKAWETGCKGCTTFRMGGKRGAILEEVKEEKDEGAGAMCRVDATTGRRECE